MVQDRSVCNDETGIIDELEQLFAYKDDDRENKFRDETCTIMETIMSKLKSLFLKATGNYPLRR